MKHIDLNCDMGELPELLADGTQEALLRFVSSANIACGGHAGSPEMMEQTIRQALRANVSIGAHPGYEDRQTMGRTEQNLSPEEVSALVHRQLCALQEIAEHCGARFGHVKAHGALYNQAARDARLAHGIADGVVRWCEQINKNRADVRMVGLAGSVMLTVFRELGFPVAAEAFADRRYEPDGSLRSRKLEGALLREPRDAANQALRIAQEQSVIAINGEFVPIEAQTICIHSDTPGAVQVAEAVHRKLREAGVSIQSLDQSP